MLVKLGKNIKAPICKLDFGDSNSDPRTLQFLISILLKSTDYATQSYFTEKNLFIDVWAQQDKSAIILLRIQAFFKVKK